MQIRFDTLHKSNPETHEAIANLECELGEHYAGAFQSYQDEPCTETYETISLVEEGSEEEFLDRLKEIPGVYTVSYYPTKTETIFWKRGENNR